jgi:hypothetical protein
VLIAWITVIDVLYLMFVMNVKKDSTGGVLFVKHMLYVTQLISVTGLKKDNNYVLHALMLCLSVIDVLTVKFVKNVMTNSTGGLMNLFVKDLLNVELILMNTGLKKDNKSAYNAQMLLKAA